MVHIEVEILDTRPRYTLRELCERCAINAETVVSFVEFGIVTPEGHSMAQWRFSAQSLSRLNRALRLQRDLEVNLPGLALVLDLLDRIEDLEQQMANRHKEF